MTMMSPHTGHVACGNHLRVYLHLYLVYNNETCQYGWPRCTNFTLKMTMTSPLFSHMTNIYGFISTSKRTIITKPGIYYASKFWPYPAERSGVTIYRLRDKHLWLYLHFCHVYSNQTLKNVTLHMTITPSPRDHVLNIYRLSPLL